MKKTLVLSLILITGGALAGPGHSKGSWYDELGLSETQKEQVKSIKKAKHEKLMAYKKELQAETDAELAEVLNGDQMDKLASMRKEHKMHKAKKKHKKKKAYSE